MAIKVDSIRNESRLPAVIIIASRSPIVSGDQRMRKSIMTIGSLVSSAMSLALFSGLTLFPEKSANAQTFPSRPIRIITYPAGGGADFGARVVEQGLTSNSNWQVIVDN